MNTLADHTPWCDVEQHEQDIRDEANEGCASPSEHFPLTIKARNGFSRKVPFVDVIRDRQVWLQQTDQAVMVRFDGLPDEIRLDELDGLIDALTALRDATKAGADIAALDAWKEARRRNCEAMNRPAPQD